jgi:outer membrane lipoprotein SlyB
MYSTFRLMALSTSAASLITLVACAPMNGPMNSPVQGSGYPTSSTSSTYPNQSGQGNYVEYGRVNNIEVLRSQGQTQGPGLGAVIGGVTGALVGSQIGGGTGRTAATVVGAVGGAVAGNAIEQNRNANASGPESYRVSVQLDNGGMRAYEVSSPGDLRPGDRVRIENNQLLRMR